MILYPDCDYYNEKRDDEFAPTNECESCYRYETCKTAYDKEKDMDKYNDIFVFVPDKKEIIRISEGTGDNLSEEDRNKGYVDYVYYDIHKLDIDMPCTDGGTLLLTKLFREQYSNTAETIPDVLDLAYGNKDMKTVILI